MMSPFPSEELKVEARLCLTKKKIWRANNFGGGSSEETFTARPLSCARRRQAADWKPSQSCAQTRRRRCWACALPGKHRLRCTFILTPNASHSQPGPSACKAGLCQCRHILQIFIELSAKTAFTTALCGDQLQFGFHDRKTFHCTLFTPNFSGFEHCEALQSCLLQAYARTPPPKRMSGLVPDVPPAGICLLTALTEVSHPAVVSKTTDCDDTGALTTLGTLVDSVMFEERSAGFTALREIRKKQRSLTPNVLFGVFMNMK